jgi:hypothetical protein
MHASETVGSMPAHTVQIFVAGHGVAYAFIREDQRARIILYLTGED